MLRRFFVIIFLLINLAWSYLLTLFAKKKKSSWLVIAAFDKFGGTKTYFFSLVEFLFKKNYAITVILEKSQCDDEVLALQRQYPFDIREMKFKLYKTTFNGTIFFDKNQEDFIYQLRELIYFMKQLRKHKCAQLVCSVNNPELLLFLFLMPVKVFYILHTVATYPLDKLKRKVLMYLSGSKQIITVSMFSKLQLLKNWTNSKHSDFIKVIYNFYEPWRKVMQLNKHSVKKVLTVGTVAHYKNPFFWIDVCKKVINNSLDNRVEFIWAGDGELLDSCRALVIGFPQIKFIGYQKNVEQLYADCDVYFQPSILESHGIAVLGAMYFEKPCVVSDRQGLPESVINNETGLIVSIDNLNDASYAIESLLNCPKKATELGKAGKKIFELKFTKSKWINEMNAVFN